MPFVMWLIAPKSFKSLGLMLVLFSLMIVLVGHGLNRRKQNRQLAALEAFLADPAEATVQGVLATVDPSWHLILQVGLAQLIEQIKWEKDKQLEWEDYQEFIEAWVHKIKTPLSLANQS